MPEIGLATCHCAEPTLGRICQVQDACTILLISAVIFCQFIGTSIELVMDPKIKRSPGLGGGGSNDWGKIAVGN